jgi:hypothetical protein
LDAWPYTGSRTQIWYECGTKGRKFGSFHPLAGSPDRERKIIVNRGFGQDRGVGEPE